METRDIINYQDNTHVITDYRYDSFGRRIHTVERSKTGMRTIYDGLSFEVVKEAETALGTRGITSSGTGEANLNNYNPQGRTNTAPTYGSDHTKGTRYYYIPNKAQGAQAARNGESTQSTPAYPSDHTKGTRYYYIPDNPQSSQAQHSAIPADRTKGVRTYLYLNGERVAVNNLYNTNHGQYYYGSDILGSVKFVTGQGGQEVKRIEYDIFGGVYKGNSPYGLETGYTGKPYDAVTGLSDYGFRDYSPKYARFITEDPIRDGENWFAYCHADPINHIDPDGYLTVSITFNGSAGAGASTTAGGGIIFGFSFEKGFSSGLIESHSIGAQQGSSAGGGITITVDPAAKEVVSGTSTSLTIGGSANMPIGVGLGGDVSADLETKQGSFSVGISAGFGTPGEVHQSYTITNTITDSDLAHKIYMNMTPLGIITLAAQERQQREQEAVQKQLTKKKSS